MESNKRFFASHAKSSAAIVSLVIHAILIIIAFTFVAATVIIKEEQSFKTKAITRPKMPLKRLQVPVNVKKKKAPKPKLRKRIVVDPKIKQTMPDIKMPEVTGVKGGIGSLGEGGVGTVGFTLPEIEIFGVKGKGEKIFLVLDTGATMMDDVMGGIAAYTIIKQELVRIVNELPATALFNVCVYLNGDSLKLAFPSMVSANKANAKKMEEWLMPLNSVRRKMDASDYGLHTLGKGGADLQTDLRIGLFKNTKKIKGSRDYHPFAWYSALMMAHKQQADSVFLLTNAWGVNHRVPLAGTGSSREEWDKTPAGVRWNKAVKEGLRKLDQENRKRKAAGQPPKILNRNEWSIIGEYSPGIESPPEPEWYHYTPRDFVEAFLLMREKHKLAGAKAIINPRGRKKKASRRDFSLNVIQFTPQGGATINGANPERFEELTTICNGEYQTISGLAEIQSYVQ